MKKEVSTVIPISIDFSAPPSHKKVLSTWCPPKSSNTTCSVIHIKYSANPRTQKIREINPKNDLFDNKRERELCLLPL